MKTIRAWDRFYEKSPRPWGGAVELPPIPPNSCVLELGCGGGRLLLPVLRGGTAVTLVGVDIARTPLVQLKKSAPGILVQADASSIPFRDEVFDIVLCRHLLGHLMEDRRKAAASEMLRVLKRGGRALFEGFSTADARFGKGRSIEKGTFIRGDGIVHHYFVEEEVRGLFCEASFVSVVTHRWSERAGAAMMEHVSLSAEVLK